MRSHRTLISAVLAVAVLAGQWLAAAHEPEHSLQPGAAHACAVCVHADGAGPVTLAIPVPLAAAAERPERVATDSPRAAAVRNHPIRGPPAALA